MWPLAFLLCLGPIEAHAGTEAAQQAAQPAPVPPTPALTLPESPLRVVGSTPLWVAGTEDTAPPTADTVLPTEDAFAELYAGRADLVLGTLPPTAAPAGATPAVSVPVGVFAVSVAYSLPGVNLRLDLPTLCALLAGKLSRWNLPAIAALNPGETLPALPVLVSARTARNGVSLAVAGACVQAGVWPASQLKSNWSGGAAFGRATLGAQRTDLNLPGTLALFSLQSTPAGVQVAALRTAGGDFAPPRSELGLQTLAYPGALPALPATPSGVLRASSVSGAYPLRGLVWASALPDQAYRGRTLARAQALQRLIVRLRSGAGRGVAGLPEGTWPPVPLTYRGQPLASQAALNRPSQPVQP